MSICLKNKDSKRSWCISPECDIDVISDYIKNSDSTKSWLASYSCSQTKLWMVLTPIMERSPNQDTSLPTYYCDKDGEWIMDQYGRCVLWIPPDERHGESCISCGGKLTIKTESGKKYFAFISLS
jgi:hypothetical protein